MKKEDLKITLDELNAIIPIFAHEFCNKNVGENDKVIIGAAAYIYQNVEDYVCGARKIDKELIEMSKCVQKLIKDYLAFERRSYKSWSNHSRYLISKMKQNG